MRSGGRSKGSAPHLKYTVNSLTLSAFANDSWRTNGGLKEMKMFRKNLDPFALFPNLKMHGDRGAG
jgi:hypothetical protein